jgi:plastocyanin
VRSAFVAIVFVWALAFADAALGANQNVSATPSSQFSPKTVNITQGDSVTWTNTGGVHNVVFDDGSFTQPPGVSSPPWTVTRSFDTPGTFLYYCALHGGPGGAGMSGSVVVSAKSTSPSDGSGGTTTPGPTTVGAQGQQPSATCASQRMFRIRIRQPRGIRIASAQVSVNGKRVDVKRIVINGKLRQTAVVDLRGLGQGTYKVDITAKTNKGRVLRGTRTYHTCVAKQVPTQLPPL